MSSTKGKGFEFNRVVLAGLLGQLVDCRYRELWIGDPATVVLCRFWDKFDKLPAIGSPILVEGRLEKGKKGMFVSVERARTVEGPI